MPYHIKYTNSILQLGARPDFINSTIYRRGA
jgi:hypothetical protein